MLIHKVFIGLVLSCALWPGAGQAESHQSSMDKRFVAIYSAEWKWRSALGDNANAPTAPLGDVSPLAHARRLANWLAVERSLASLNLQKLSPENRVNYAVYKAQVDALLAEEQFHEYERPVNSDSSFWGDLTYIAQQTFHTQTDYQAYIAKLNDMPRYFDQEIANMRAGLARHFTPPKVTLKGREAAISQVIEIARPEDSVYYRPFITMPSDIAPDVQAQLRSQAASAISNAVIPAHKGLLTFFNSEYVPGATQVLAATALPDGPAYYQSKIREFTTLDLTPDQIHQIGLSEIAKIREQMRTAMEDAGFQGDFPAFLVYLRHEPKFYAKSPQDLLDRAAWVAKRFDGVSAKWFGRLPRQRFGIYPVAAEIAPFYTSGRGGPGAYSVNTYDLASRPLFQLPALTLHESAPGHAFQMPLANENHTLPDFRRKTYISAYGEGWALYSERLGVEMGIYETPYDRFGYLSYQAWRAARLVVDTGIHAKGWSRAQAIDYLRDNTALSQHEIETEVDRYISWPGQALSYYLGEMAIVAAREKAEKTLGAKFNIRAFHDAVLELGSVPLPVLTAHIDELITHAGIGPYPDEE